MKGKEEFKKIVLGTDHGGYELKEILKGYLTQAGYKIVDVMPEYINPISFVIAANKVCEKVKNKKEKRITEEQEEILSRTLESRA